MKALSRLTALLLVFLHGGQAMEEMRFKGSALEPGAAGAASVRTGGAMQSPTLRGGQPAAGQNGGGAAGVAAPGGAGAAGAAGAAGGMGLGGAPLGVPMGTRVKDDPELLARMGGGMASGGIYVHPYIRPGPDIDRFSFHNISIEDYPFVVCRSKTQCDYHLKKPAYYKSESYSVYRANAVSDTPLGRFTMSETARDRLDIKLLNTPNPVGWGEFNRGFSNSQKLCCHDYITKYLAVISMNDAAGACEPGQDHEVCRSAGNIVEGPNDSMRNLIEQPQRIWDFFGVPGPNNLQSKRNRAIKLIMFQLMMAMTQLERKRAVSRRLGWSHIFYSHDQQPPRVRMSTMLVENMSFFKYMRNLLVKDRADQAPFMIPMRSDNPLVQRGHVLQAPELNERILSPYFLDKRMADLIVDKRLADKHKERNPYRKLGHVKEHASWDEEARDLEWRTPPKSFHAPDIWNLGVMLLQLISGSFKGTRDLQMLTNIEMYLGCNTPNLSDKLTPPFSRSYDTEMKSIKRYMPTIDYLMYQTFNFQPGPPDLDWRAMLADPQKKLYVPLLKRMLDCDYRARARIDEVVELILQLPGGQVAPSPDV